jgi:hypothetical protein
MSVFYCKPGFFQRKAASKIAISLFFALFIFTSDASFSQQESTYSKIKIENINQQTITILSSIGIPLEESYYDKDNNSLRLYVNEIELSEINKKGIKFSILIDDVEKWNEERLSNDALKLLKTNDDTLKGFFFGSMSGYPYLSEFIRMLDTMNILYPNLASQKISIGKTYEGRDIYLARITNQHNTDTSKRKVLFTGLTHAREGTSVTTILYYMFYLMEKYGTDSLVTYLLDNTEMYFVPMVNPDGYVYNQTLYPRGGGMWRKNRSLVNGYAYGVDLNRNFGYNWGYDNSGSSNYASDETYRGLSAFSELETQALRKLCQENKFITAINYHTYSNEMVYPWGYINKQTPDSIYYRYYCKEMSNYNGYIYGTSAETVYYQTNGDSDDWMYGEQSEKNKTLALTFEVGGEDDGFWAPKSRIIPIAQENIKPNLFYSSVTGAYINNITISADSAMSIGDTAKLKVNIKNIGLLKAENIRISPGFSDTALLADKESIDLPDLSSFGSIDTVLNFGLRWRLNTPPGYIANYNITLSYNGFPVTKSMSMERSFNTPVEYSSYNSKQDGSTILLSWSTIYEKNNSQFYVERTTISNNGSNEFQQIGIVKGSKNSDSVSKYIYIDTLGSDLLQNLPITFSYRLRTVDTNNISKYSDTTQITIKEILNVESSQPVSYFLNQNYPNPFNPETTIEYGLSESGRVSIVLYDILGREVKTLVNEYKTPGSYHIQMSSKDLPSQVYFYRINVNNFSEIKKMVVIR